MRSSILLAIVLSGINFGCKHSSSAAEAKEVHDTELLSPNRLTVGGILSDRGLSVISCPYQSSYNNQNYEQIRDLFGGQSASDIQSGLAKTACKPLLLIDGNMYFFGSQAEIQDFRDRFLIPGIKKLSDFAITPNPTPVADTILSTSASSGYLDGGVVEQLRLTVIEAFTLYAAELRNRNQ